MLQKSGSGTTECPKNHQAHQLMINGFPGRLTCSHEVAIKPSAVIHCEVPNCTKPGQAYWEWLQRDGGRCCIYTNCGTSSRTATGCTTHLLGEESCRVPYLQMLDQSCESNHSSFHLVVLVDMYISVILEVWPQFPLCWSDSTLSFMA